MSSACPSLVLFTFSDNVITAKDCKVNFDGQINIYSQFLQNVSQYPKCNPPFNFKLISELIRPSTLLTLNSSFNNTKFKPLYSTLLTLIPLPSKGTTNSREFPCPVGSYSNSTRLANITECRLCPAGFYCDAENVTAPTGPCAQGHLSGQM